MTAGRMKQKLIGDLAFYRMVLAVAVPIMIQNGITNFVGMLDNIMVGRIGTNEMSGVAIVNQLLFVFALCIFGGVAGAGIFTAQFYGAKDEEGVRNTFRFKIVVTTLITFISILVFLFFGDELIRLFLHEGIGEGVSVSVTFEQAKIYMLYMLLGNLPFGITQSYADTLRCTGETVLPMKVGTFSVFVNLFLNYIFIYGSFGFPALGVVGAALATVISRYAEAAVIVIWTHRHKKEHPFAEGAYRSMKIPKKLAKNMIKKVLPLLTNETIWSLGIAALIQSYSLRGLHVVGALNISQTIANLFGVTTIAMGSATSILLGQKLGAGKIKTAKDYAVKLIFFTEVLSLFVAVFLFVIAPMFPMVYNTTDGIKDLATIFIRVGAVFIPVYAFGTSCYFIIRSGGKTFITFLFDGAFTVIFVIPVAYLLVYYTEYNIITIYILVQSIGFIKGGLGAWLVKKGIWLNNLL